MLQPPFYLPSKIRMLWAIRFHSSHRLFSCLRNHSTVSLTIPLGDWVYLWCLFQAIYFIVPRCKQKQGSAWDSPFKVLHNAQITFTSIVYPQFIYMIYVICTSSQNESYSHNSSQSLLLVHLPFQSAAPSFSVRTEGKPLWRRHHTCFPSSSLACRLWWVRFVQTGFLKGAHWTGQGRLRFTEMSSLVTHKNFAWQNSLSPVPVVHHIPQQSWSNWSWLERTHPPCFPSNAHN